MNVGKKFVLKTLGCKTNAIEGQIIASTLLEAGFSQVEDFSGADIFILNSCSVTSHSDSQSAYLLNRAKRENPLIKNILTGCVAQTIDMHKGFELENVDLILGNNEKLDIEKYLFKEEKKCVGDIFALEKFNHKTVQNPYQTRVSIKIQEGCNNRCSYCIIPYARGNSRSNSVENILEQIELLAKNGTKEAVLTGIHIGQWGLERGLELVDLLYEIEKSPIARFRLGSLYVNEIDRKLLEFLKVSKKFCPHFHLSLQSLCDKTLCNMNRNYTSTEALEIMEKLYNSFDEPFLGCDIIAGFPGESDEDFEITYKNLLSSKISYIHAFPYSKRENTPAAKMKEQICDTVKTRRTQRLIELSKDKHNAFLERNKNKTHELLFERKSPKTGAYSAVTRNYIKVFIKDERDNLRNTLKAVDMSTFDKLY